MQNNFKSIKSMWKSHGKVKNNSNFLKLVIHRSYYKELLKDVNLSGRLWIWLYFNILRKTFPSEKIRDNKDLKTITFFYYLIFKNVFHNYKETNIF